MDSKQQPKRKRGRPRKNTEKLEAKIDVKRAKKDENIVLFLALSDEESSKSNSEDDNRFTVNDSEPNNRTTIYPLTDCESDSNSEAEYHDGLNLKPTSEMTVKSLVEEVKKRDIIIAHLRSKGGSVLSSYNTAKPTNINYHCVQVADSDTGKSFVPETTDCDCWWCDEQFDNLPAYLVNYYRNGIYYIFGNFCSFNCALKYNIKLLKDFKCDTRRALTLSLRMKVTGETGCIKLAGDRELLKSKKGNLTIEQFREGFSIVSTDMKLSMPPMIPLVHVIEEIKRD